MKSVQLFINGEFSDASDSQTFASFDSATGEQIAECALPSTTDINRAVDTAHDAFYSKEWKEMSQEKRSEILLKVAELIKERRKELTEWEIKDSGSTVRKAKADVHNAAGFFKVMSKTAAKLSLTEVDERASREGFSKNSRIYEPIGVCAGIIPWNFPLVMAAWKIGPILATGCTMVLKSAGETPITASILAEILRDAGVPAGVINIISGGAKEGRELVNHSKISKVAFTGSTSVGKEILKSCAEKVTKTTLELGGKSANIVLDDADFDIAIDGALYAFLYHQGQACDSGTRLLVHEKVYDDFVAKLIKRAAEVKIGLPNDPAAGFTCLINEKQSNTVMSYIEKTKEEGAKLLYGGNKLSEGDFAKGHYIEPTFFEITPDHTIFHEEIFGPVVGITKFKTDEEAINLANHSEYGLAGAVWSKDPERARAVASKIEAGTVWINEYHLLNPGMPFGGYKQSGLGREMGSEGIHEYLEVKHLWESDCNTREGKMWFDALF